MTVTYFYRSRPKPVTADMTEWFDVTSFVPRLGPRGETLRIEKLAATVEIRDGAPFVTVYARCVTV